MFADFIDDTTWRKMLAQVRTEHGGTRRRLMMLRGAGKGGVQWVNMGLTQQEMQYLQSRQFTKEEIYQDLAPGLLQILEKNATEANALAGEKTFREYCIWPMMQRIAEMFTAALLPRYGEKLVGEFKDIRHRDRQTELAEQQRYADSHTVEELRREYYDDEPLANNDPRNTMFVAEIKGGAVPGRNGNSGGGAGAALPAVTDPVQSSVDQTAAAQNAAAAKRMGDGGAAGAAARRVAGVPLLAEEPELEESAKAIVLAQENIDKAIERGRFRRFAMRRLKGGKPAEIAEFRFSHLTEAEQKDLIGETLGTEVLESMKQLDAANTAVSGGQFLREDQLVFAEPTSRPPREFTRILMLVDLENDPEQDPELIEASREVKQILAARMPTELVFVKTPQEIEQALADFDPRDTLVYNWAENLPGWIGGGESVTALVEEAGFAHTASYAATQRLIFDRGQTFLFAKELGIMVPRFQMVYSPPDVSLWERWPAIIRPNECHGSEDLAVVGSPEDAQAYLVDMVQKHQLPAILLEYISPAREFSVGLLSDGKEIDALPIAEANFAALEHDIKDETDKGPGGPDASEQNIIPAHIEPELKRKLVDQSKEIFGAIGCKIYFRADWRLYEGESDPILIDVNPEPTVSTDSLMAEMAKTAGLSFGDLVLGILDRALTYYRDLDTQPEQHEYALDPDTQDVLDDWAVDDTHGYASKAANRAPDHHKRRRHEKQLNLLLAGYFSGQLKRIKQHMSANPPHVYR